MTNKISTIKCFPGLLKITLYSLSKYILNVIYSLSSYIKRCKTTELNKKQLYALRKRCETAKTILITKLLEKTNKFFHLLVVMN